MKYFTYLICSVLFMPLSPTKAQEPDARQLLNKVTAFYADANTYQIEMTFSMLRGLTGNEVTKSYQATMEKNGDYLKNSIQGTEVYNFPSAKVVVDGKKKRIIYSDSEDGPDKNNPIDISIFLKYYGKTKVTDLGELWACEMEETENSGRLPYKKVTLFINKKDYSVAKQELYFSDLVPFTSEDGEKTERDNARLLVELSHDLEPGIKNKTLKDFLLIGTDNKVKLQNEFADYELVNQTKNNK